VLKGIKSLPRSFNFYMHAIGLIRDEAFQLMPYSQPINEGTKSDSLNNTLDMDASTF
jgi:hypothetical protein